MRFTDFADLLKASMGLDAASIGESAVERAVLERTAACGVAGPDAYWQRVSASPLELQNLIDAVIVPETWFFRDREAFSTLVRLARDASWAAPAGGVRRILSLPSSTGEEPYSIAMALFDAGVSPGRFGIDAIDISAHNITVAQAAVYRKNSFRGRELGFRSRYFEATAPGYVLAERVRRQVQFRQGNLLAPNIALEPAAYDVIFCRNLLIYFDRPTQERAVRALERLLTPEGVVLVAPSETSVLLNHGLVPLQAPFAFAFRTAAGAAAREPQVRRRKPVRLKPDTTTVRPSTTTVRLKPDTTYDPEPGRGTTPADVVSAFRRTVEPPATPTTVPSPKVGAPPEAAVTLDEAAELANRGRFEEAIERCERHLARSGPSAEVFHLMGLVRDASGDLAEAVSCYRKALYLDPNHDEVLVHLTLLLEKSGKTSEAQLLRKRAHRLQQGGGSKNAPAR